MRRLPATAAALAAAVAAALVFFGASVPNASAATVRLPPAGARADYQLGGAYRLPVGVRIVSRDRTDAPARGAYNICYLNAFQTQPQETAWWRTRHPSLLLHTAAGREVHDPGWPGEVLLDVSTAAKRSVLASIVGHWIDGCAAKGFAAIEPDNLDSWTRSRGLLQFPQAVAFARLLVARAHLRGLAIAQKNTSELASKGRQIGFDFAVAEECQVYAECGVYIAAYGRAVIEIEYSDNGRSWFTAACSARAGRVAIVYRDRQLTMPGDPAYVYASC